MAGRDAETWMWSEACEMLARAERLQRQFFQIRRAEPAPAWEPPVDVLETDEDVHVLVALPGVEPESAEASIDRDGLIISGRRTIPPILHNAVIHRLELPQGRFERRVPLPPGRYDQIRRAAMNGCVVISLRKTR
jgi:HSP20 family protein